MYVPPWVCKQAAEGVSAGQAEGMRRDVDDDVTRAAERAAERHVGGRLQQHQRAGADRDVPGAADAGERQTEAAEIERAARRNVDDLRIQGGRTAHAQRPWGQAVRAEG